MKLSALNVEEKRDDTPVEELPIPPDVVIPNVSLRNKEWAQVPDHLFFSWPESKQLRYCGLKDRHASFHAKTQTEKEFFAARAAQYFYDAQVAAQKEAAQRVQAGEKKETELEDVAEQLALKQHPRGGWSVCLGLIRGD